MAFNTQKQINMISEFILAGKLPPEFDFYPVKTAKTLYYHSGGKICINVEPYCKKALEKSIKKLNEKSEELNIAKTSRDSSIKKKLNLQNEIKNVEQDIEDLNDKVKTLISETKYEQVLQTSIESYLKKRE